MDTFPAGNVLARAGAVFGALVLLYGLVVACLGYMPEHQPNAPQARASFLTHVHTYPGQATAPPETAEQSPTASGVQFSAHSDGMDQGTPALSTAVLLPPDHLALNQDPLAIDVSGAYGDVPASHSLLPEQPPRA